MSHVTTVFCRTLRSRPSETADAFYRLTGISAFYTPTALTEAERTYFVIKATDVRGDGIATHQQSTYDPEFLFFALHRTGRIRLYKFYCSARTLMQ